MLEKNKVKWHAFENEAIFDYNYGNRDPYVVLELN